MAVCTCASIMPAHAMGPDYIGRKYAGASADCLSFASLAETRHYQFRKPRFVGAGLALPWARHSSAPTLNLLSA